MVCVSIIKLFDCKKKIKNPLKNKIKTSNSLLTDISLCLALVTSTILVKTFGTLCVLGVENVIQVDPLPPEHCWVLQVKTPFTYLANIKDLNFVQGPGGGGKILLRPCLRVCIAG